MVKHRKSNTPDVHVSAGGSSVHSKKPRSSKATWILIAAFVVVFGGLGSYLLTSSHADTVNNMNLYRLRNSQGHLYTTSSSEVTSAIANGFISEATYPFSTQDGSTQVPVYGAVKGTSHFLTESAT